MPYGADDLECDMTAADVDSILLTMWDIDADLRELGATVDDPLLAAAREKLDAVMGGLALSVEDER